MSVCRLRTDVTLTIWSFPSILMMSARYFGPHSYLGVERCGFSRYLLSSPQVAWGSLHGQYIMARACRLLLFIWRSPFFLVLYLPNLSPLVTVGFRRSFPPLLGYEAIRCGAEFHCIRVIGMVEQFFNVRQMSRTPVMSI
jgi:hypothetical protein